MNLHLNPYLVRTFAAGLVGAACAAWPVCAQASGTSGSSCATAADCSHGFSCEVVGTSGCPAQPPCAKGDECTVVACDPVTTSACVPAACQGDGDCAAGMVCHSSESTACSGGGAACSSDGACTGSDLPPTCQTVSGPAVCTSHYNLPCTTASDCGSGFDCFAAGGSVEAPGQAVIVDGSTTGTGTVDAGAPLVYVDAGLPIEYVDAGNSGVCVPKTIVCTSAADCPAAANGSWTCSPPPPVACACPAIMLDAGSVPCTCDTPEAGTGASTCTPPSDYAPSGGSGNGYAPMSAGGADAGALATGSAQNADAGRTPASSPTSSGGANPGVPDGATNGEAPQSSGEGSSDGGCSMAPRDTPPTGASSVLLVALGALVGRRRPRR